MAWLATKLLIAIIMVQCSLSQVAFKNIQLTTPRKGIASAVVNSSVYFIGGLNNNDNVATPLIEIYNSYSDTWDAMTLTSPRGFITPIISEPNIYLIGGYDWINIPYIYSPSDRDFLQLTNSSGPTVRNPTQISIFDSVLVVAGDYSVDFLDINTMIWSYNETLTQLMNQNPGAHVIVAENVIIVIEPTRSTSAWIYDIQTTKIIQHNNVVDGGSTDIVRFEGSNGVVFLIFNDKCLLYNVAKNEWRTWNTTNIRFVAHAGGYSYVLGDYLFSDNWNNSLSFIGLATHTHQFTFGAYVCFMYAANIRVNYGGVGQSFPVPYDALSTDQFSHGVEWGEDKYVFADGKIVNLLSASNRNITLIGDFSPLVVEALFVLDSDRIAIFTADFVMHIYNGNTLALDMYTVSFVPEYLIGDQFFTLSMSFLVSDPASITEFQSNFGSRPTFVSRSGDSLIAILRDADAVYYKAMDIYNYQDDEWILNATMPSELFRILNAAPVPTPVFFFNAALVNNEMIFLWNLDGFATYNISGNEWSAVETLAITIYPFPSFGQSFALEPIVDDSIFIGSYTLEYFYQIDINSRNWTKTSDLSSNDPTSAETFNLIQRVAYNNKIYALRYSSSAQKIDAIVYYDPSSGNWDSTLLPFAVQFASMVLANETLVVFTMNSTLFYWQIGSAEWYTSPFSYNFMPSVATATASHLFVGGGIDSYTGVLNDQVAIFAISDFVPPPVAVISPNQQPSDVSGLSGDSPLIAAIIVPIVVVIAAGVALLIILIRRRDKKRKNSVTTVGLEARYGEWFTPFSDIQFGDQLGQGANGQVFKGRWKNTEVALKVSMTQANSSVISELSLMINLRSHPNIVQLLGFSVHPETDSVILILEFCNGGSLDNALFNENSTTVIPLEKKISWIKEIASGINHLHSNNIVHRDIAARNILLHNDEAKVTDFGMSRLIDEQQQRGTTKSELGPIRWMAPEALKEKQYSAKSDAWSFGILMFEVIAQQEPHLNEDPITVGRSIRDEGKTPSVPSSCPPALATLIQNCWKMNPDHRPSFAQILEELEKL
jgi:predicted Ser/Thr protein kinase